VVETVTTTVLWQIFSRVCSWKNFENRLSTVTVLQRLWWTMQELWFFWNTIYVSNMIFRTDNEKAGGTGQSWSFIDGCDLVLALVCQFRLADCQRVLVSVWWQSQPVAGCQLNAILVPAPDAYYTLSQTGYILGVESNQNVLPKQKTQIPNFRNVESLSSQDWLNILKILNMVAFVINYSVR